MLVGETDLKFSTYPFRDNLLNVHTKRLPGKPLAGLKILDVGCGGGLLTEVSVCSRQMQPQRQLRW